MQINKNTLTWVKPVIFLIMSFTLLSCGDTQVNDGQLVETAKAYIKENKIRGAAIELKNALLANSSNAEARYLLGQINLDVGDTASAEKEFRRAMEAGWPEEQPAIGIARAKIDSRRYQALLDEIAIKDAYSANARADLHALKALAYANLEKMEDAQSSLNKAAEIDSSAFYVHKATVQLQLANGNIKAAEESLGKVPEIYKDNRDILLLFAITKFKNNDIDETTKAYRRIVELEPKNLVTVYGRKARLALARIEIVNDKLDVAENMIKPLIRQNGKDPETNFVRGLLAYEKGNLDLAEEFLLKVLKVAPDHETTQLLFGTVSYAQKDYEQSAYYIAKYISAVPGNLGARKLLGRTYIKLGQHSEAEAALMPGLEGSADDAELLALVGLSQLQGGDLVAGIEGLEKAVLASPQSASLRSQLANAYISAGETENAINELNTILAEGGDRKQTEALLIKAHLKAEDYEKAINVVLGMVQQYPDDPAVMAMAGSVFVASNDRPEGRKYFNKALSIKPGYVHATMLLARLEELEGAPEKARQLYEGLADSNKENITPLLALARLAEIQNQKVEMVNWLELARERSDEDLQSRKMLAEYYLREGRQDKVDELLKESMEIAPRDNTLLTMQARLQMAAGQYNKAVSSLLKLVTRNPDSVFARALLGETYVKLEQFEDGRNQLEIVLKKEPYYVPALVLMGSIELKAGKFQKASQHAATIQKTQPDLYMGYEIAGDAAMGQKDYLQAKASYTRAWEKSPLAEMAIKLSEANSRMGKLEAATDALLAWTKNYPENARVYQFLGTVYQNRKLNAKAIEAFEKSLAANASNAVALNNLAWLYSLSGDSRALEFAEKAYQQAPEDKSVQDTYGWVQVQQGDARKGRQILEQVVKTLQSIPEVQYHYAVALIKTGDEARGKEILARLLDSGKSFEGREDASQLMK